MKNKFSLGLIQVLHPATIKHLNVGHPWVTIDNYSLKFPDTILLYWRDMPNKKIILFIKDPHHPQVCARKLTVVTPMEFQEWERSPSETLRLYFKNSLRLAFQKRIKLGIKNRRENEFLFFQEADGIPALQILRLATEIIFIFHGSFWEQEIWKDVLFETYHEEAGSQFLPTDVKHLWYQNREINPGKSKESSYPVRINKTDQLAPPFETFIQEEGVQMKIGLGQSYDYGIYTDMACIRKKIHEKFSHYWRGSKVLNLFSYSGMFSFQAIDWEASAVTSVDNNEKSWLLFEENLKANSQNPDFHEKLNLGIFDALSKLTKDKRIFDVIIVDPPPSFTDLKSKYSVEDFYRKALPQLLGMLSPKGLMVVFCNKHKVTWKEFRTIFLGDPKSKWSIEEEFQLQEDCPTIPNYSEGNYLKGLALAIKSERRIT